MPAVKQKKGENFVKACMNCKSSNIKIFSPDDNDAYGLNPKYECLDCGSVGVPVEIQLKENAKAVRKRFA